MVKNKENDVIIADVVQDKHIRAKFVRKNGDILIWILNKIRLLKKEDLRI